MIKLRVEGLKDLEQSLIELPKATSRNVVLRSLTLYAKRIASLASRLAPDDPGTRGKDLKSSIATQTVSARQRESSVEVAISWLKRIRHGGFQEMGSANNSPHPFLRPAFDENVPVVIAGLKQDLAAELEKARQRIARKAERLAAKMKT